MARANGLYSNLVAGLKIILPLAALALLSTLFLLSRSSDPINDVPFTDAQSSGSGDSVREQVNAPYYAGTTDRGDVLTMTARAARPDGADLIHADELSATLRFKDGSELQLVAQSATVDNADRRARMQNGVRIQSSTGYDLVTESLTSALDRTFAESDGPVSGTGPAGTLEAGRMRVEPTGNGDDVELLFTGGVKLVYLPQQE